MKRKVIDWFGDSPIQKSFIILAIVAHMASAVAQHFFAVQLSNRGYWSFSPGFQEEIVRWNIVAIAWGLVALISPKHLSRTAAIGLYALAWFGFGTNHLTKPVETWHAAIACVELVGCIVGGIIVAFDILDNS